MFYKSVNFEDFEKKIWPNFKKLGVLKITKRRAQSISDIISRKYFCEKKIFLYAKIKKSALGKN